MYFGLGSTRVMADVQAQERKLNRSARWRGRCGAPGQLGGEEEQQRTGEPHSGGTLDIRREAG